MGARRIVVPAVAILAAAASTTFARSAQDALSPLQIALACAPPAAFEAPADARLRIIGSQDPVPRTMFHDRDVLVIGGGSDAGLRVGQEFFVRRAITSHTSDMDRGRPAITAGWITVVSLNERNALASVEHACGAIFESDYLVPFTAPPVPAGAERDEAAGELDFASPARVIAASENHQTAARGDFVLMDRGSQQGVAPGARFAIFRLPGSGLPLTTVGEAVVMSAGVSTSVVRITQSRGAIEPGDYLVPRR